MRAWERRKKWLTKKAVWNCLLISAAVLVIAVIFEFARIVVTSNLPTMEKTLHLISMWVLLAGFLLLYGILAPELMEVVFTMLGFKEKGDKNDENKAKLSETEKASTSKIMETIRKIGKILRKTSKLSLIAFVTSLIATSPITSRFIIYYIYEPKIWVFFGSVENYFDRKTTFNLSEVLESALNIINNDLERDIRIEIEFIASKPIKVNPRLEGYFIEKGLGGNGFRFLTKSFYLPAHSTLGLTYLFQPYYEKFTLEVIIYSKMKMSEFGLPIFFGDIDLRPVGETFTIKP